jgi:hypothetical protein
LALCQGLCHIYFYSSFEHNYTVSATSKAKGAQVMNTRALNESEISTLMAALRLWQRELCRTGLPEWADEYFRDCEPLTIDQIDELCELLTCGEK